jgi:hypothetical protein
MKLARDTCHLSGSARVKRSMGAYSGNAPRTRANIRGSETVGDIIIFRRSKSPLPEILARVKADQDLLWAGMIFRAEVASKACAARGGVG